MAGSITADDDAALHRKKKHVALLAFPFGTHAPPLFALARLLALSNPLATFSFFTSARSNASLLESTISNRNVEHATPNLNSYDVSDGVPAGDGAPRLPPPEAVRLFLQVSPENFISAMAASKAAFGKFTCIVSDAFLWFAAEMAERAGVAWVPIWAGGPGSLLAHLHTSLLRSRIIIGSTPSGDDEEDDLGGIVPALALVRVGDLPEGIVCGDLEDPFAAMLCRMVKVLPARAAAVGINTFEGIDPALDEALAAQLKTIKCLAIGPIGLLQQETKTSAEEDDRYGCLAWLNDVDDGREMMRAAAPVVYVSFGSMVVPPPEIMAGLAGGLEESGAPFLWSLNQAAWSHLPPGFLQRTSARGLVVPWAPQLQVLGHKAVGVFLTHCGWNSVMESLAVGMPMICVPFFGDQRLNASIVCRVWGVGISLDGGVTKDIVAGAVSLVFGSEAGTEMREKADELGRLLLKATEPRGRSLANLEELSRIIIGCD